MNPPPRLKLNTKGSSREPSLDITTPIISTPTSTVATPGGGPPKVKLTIKPNSTQSTPGPTDPPKSKKPKPNGKLKLGLKVIGGKRKIKHESDSDTENVGHSISVQPPDMKRVKISIKQNVKPSAPSPITPAQGLVLKTNIKNRKAPSRGPGVGYDSEASDNEKDPTIEEGFILRLPPGEDNVYLAKAIEEKKIGLGKGVVGAAEITMKFFDGSCRRGMITVRNHIYAATMVDLPCIVEGMKSWDKRGWWKSIDICQMFLGFARVQSEEEARLIALPGEIDRDTHQYPHGLTAPMHYVRKRRFRKRLHKSTIERVEEEVQKLMDADARAVNSDYQVIDPDLEERRKSLYGRDSVSVYGGHGEDEDAEGEDDDDQGYFDHQPPHEYEQEQVDTADLEREMEEAFEADLIEEEDDVATPAMAETPSAAAVPELGPEEDSGDESFDDDEGMDDGVILAPEIDEEEKARLARIEGTKEDIAELEKKIGENQLKLSAQANPILQRRIEDTLRKLKSELQLKKSSIDQEEQNE